MGGGSDLKDGNFENSLSVDTVGLRCGCIMSRQMVTGIAAKGIFVSKISIPGSMCVQMRTECNLRVARRDSVRVDPCFTWYKSKQSQPMKRPSPEPDELQSLLGYRRLLCPAFGNPSSLHLRSDLWRSQGCLFGTIHHPPPTQSDMAALP